VPDIKMLSRDDRSVCNMLPFVVTSGLRFFLLFLYLNGKIKKEIEKGARKKKERKNKRWVTEKQIMKEERKREGGSGRKKGHKENGYRQIFPHLLMNEGERILGEKKNGEEGRKGNGHRQTNNATNHLRFVSIHNTKHWKNKN
jgi:hypothetical protein